MLASDLQLREHVQEELVWEPQIDPASIGVAVKDAIVTLSGTVNNYAQKHAAGRVVTNIRGVRAVANEIEVALPTDDHRSDEDIAHTIALIFQWDTTIPAGRVRAEVSQGWVTLEGAVEWQYQRAAAERAIHGLMGVQGITNAITIEPAKPRPLIGNHLKSAMERTFSPETEICIVLDGDTVILSGPAASLTERDNVERVAWNMPGVRYVQNHIEIGPLEAISYAGRG